MPEIDKLRRMLSSDDQFEQYHYRHKIPVTSRHDQPFLHRSVFVESERAMSVDKKGLDDIPGNSRPASIDATQEPAQCLENDDRAGSDALGQQDTEAGLEKRPSTIVPYTIYNLTQKRLLVTLVSIAGFFSPLNSNIVNRVAKSRSGMN